MKRLALFLCLALTFPVVALAQPTISKVFTPSTIGPGSVSTITFTITNGSASPVTGLAFTDVLPGAITIADPANASTDCELGVSGALTAPDGGGTITLSDAQIGAFESCTVTVDVTASTAGMHTNPAITLNSSAGSSMSLAVDLTVDTALPGFSKSFAPSSVSLGGRSTLTFTINNMANGSVVEELDFTDNLPSGMEIADPANLANTCTSPLALLEATVTAIPGTSVITLDANGTAAFPSLAAGATCTLSVDVTATAADELDNVSSDLLAEFVSAGGASATLEVTVTGLAMQKSFTDDPVPPGGPVTLDFTITNFDRDFSATAIAFTDDLTTMVPALAGLTFSSLLSNDCGGSVSGVGGTTIGFTGGTLAAEGSCTISVSLSVPAGGTPGTYTNTTGTVTGTVDGSPVVGNMAADDLFVSPAPVLTKTFMGDPVNPGDTIVLEFTATNTSTTSSATGVAFEDLFDSVLQTAPVTPGNDCCGAGSICTFTPLFNPPLDSVIPATLTISGGTLAPAGMAGDSCTFSITLDVNTDASPGLYPNTTSEITATVDGATRTGDPASDTFTVISAPSLSKAFTDDPVAPGGTVTLEFTLTHSLNATTDATAISFTDDLTLTLVSLMTTIPNLSLTEVCDPDGPGGDLGTGTLSGSAGDTLLTFMGGTLSPGESCTFSVSLDVPMGAAPGTYANTTSGVGATVEGLPATSAPAEDDLNVAGLVFTKEFLGDPVIPGDTVTLRFTIENIHPTDDATITLFTDNLADVLPGIMAVDDLSTTLPPTVDTCGGTPGLLGSSLVTYVGGSVMTGLTCMVEFDVLVPAAAPDGSHLNVTSNLTAMQGGAVTIDPATDLLAVNSNLLQLTKAFTDDPVAPGGTVNLRFTLTNLDVANAASDIDFTDDLDTALSGLLATGLGVPVAACGGMVSTPDAGMTIDFSGGSLGLGGECFFDVAVDVPGGAAASIYTNTTSDVTGTIGGFAVSGDAASDDLEVIQLLTFSKSFDGPTTATGMATLTFTITNPGVDTVTDIEFSDNLDDVISGLIAISLPALPCGAGSSLTGVGFLTFTGGELPPMGGMCSFEVDVLVPATATAGTFPNVTSDLSIFGLKVSDPATADLVIEPPPTFAKVFMTNPIFAGGTSTLRFTIDNSASAFGASSLAFTDSLPAGVVVATPSVTANTCGGTLTATAGTSTISLTGGSVGVGSTCTIDVDVTSSTSGMHVNTTGDLTSSTGNSGTATDTLTVNAAADLSVTKTDGVTSATPGGSVTYTIVVANAGPSTDPLVTLSDTFPSPPLTCTYTSLAAGGATGNTAAGSGDLSETLSMPAGSSVTYTAICAIDSDATGTLSNTASITPSITDTAPGNNSATDSDTVLVPSADLAIIKDDGVTSAVPGQTSLVYTIVASNGGPSDDPSVSVTDTFPAVLSCSYTSFAAGGATGNTSGSGDLAETLSLPAGSSVTYTVSCTIDADATGTLSNTATISGSVTDPVPGNNSATDGDTVLSPEVDLAVTKTDGVTSAIPGQTILTYTIVVSNGGPSDDPAATLTDVLPVELTCTWTSVAAGGATGNTAAGSGDLAETLSMPDGSSVTYTLSCDIDPDAFGTLSNTATVTSSVTDPAPGNNSATDDDTVLLDVVPPTVTAVTTSAGPLELCDDVRLPISTIDVTIEDEHTPVVGADDTGNYLLLGAGPDGDFLTLGCAGGVAGDDVPIAIQSLSLTGVDPLVANVELTVAGVNGLAAGLYRFFVCDSITDTAGNALDGDGDMTAGGDFEVPFFRANPFNLFTNGHFDDCPVSLDPWIATVTAPNTIQPGAPGTDDVVASPLSASAHALHSVDEASSLGQCVAVAGGTDHHLEAQVRFEPIASALANFVMTCEFFDAAACAGASLGSPATASLLEDEGGAWVAVADDLTTPVGAVSALCDFAVESLGPDPNFDLFVDGLFLGVFGLPDTIFTDGFESGDTTAWSLTTP